MAHRIPTFATAPLVLLLGACAATTADEPEAPLTFDTSRQCFFASQINGYSDAPDGPGGEERLTVSTGVNDDWLFEAFGNTCRELDFAENVAFDTRQLSLCTGTTETLLVPRGGSGPPDRCSVRLLGKVTNPQR